MQLGMQIAREWPLEDNPRILTKILNTATETTARQVSDKFALRVLGVSAMRPGLPREMFKTCSLGFRLEVRAMRVPNPALGL